jgi:ERCC4-type nuclease
MDIFYEVRQLPVGDMTWIAQGFGDNRRRCSVYLCEKNRLLLRSSQVLRSMIVPNNNSTSGSEGGWERLGKIPLSAASWSATPPDTQSGLPQVCLLVEGDTSRKSLKGSTGVIESTIMEARHNSNFFILRSEGVRETAAFVERMHRQVVRRAFPRVVGTAELSSTFEPVARSACSQAPYPIGKGLEARMKIFYGNDPVSPDAAYRFITFDELKTKVELDREVYARTVGGIHASMLKQVPFISDDKVKAIVRHYPTNCHMLEAYDNLSKIGSDGHGSTKARNLKPIQDTFLSGLSIAEPETLRTRHLGARSATELQSVYGALRG